MLLPEDPLAGPAALATLERHFPGESVADAPFAQAPFTPSAAARAPRPRPPPRGAPLWACRPPAEGRGLFSRGSARWGWGAAPATEGVTLVITPTVALAEDQERAARGRGFADGALAYVGGNSV